MSDDRLELEIRVDGRWRPIGHVQLLGLRKEGTAAATEFVYDLDYATEYSARGGKYAVSCLAPVGFEPILFDGWPPFLLDLFPQGAALRYIVEHYRIADRPGNYWKIIKTAQLNPPGNLRVVVAGADTDENTKPHPGFEYREVVAKGPDFLEYMIAHGAPVAGTTGAAGAAPKFLLREDFQGRFHADGSLPDRDTQHCWLVKFPRGNTKIDKDILRAEKAYADIAKKVGISVWRHLKWEKDCLFIPRFDRPLENNEIHYMGLESFYSLVGLSEFGSRLHHETYITALQRFSSNSQDDIVEYVLRDLLNLMMGNTDNHGRNTSVIKANGWIRLAPLYDFAPMKFDPEGVVRNTRWSPQVGDGDVANIATFLWEQCGIASEVFRRRLSQFYNIVSNLEILMRSHGVADPFIKGTESDRKVHLDAIASYLGKSS